MWEKNTNMTEDADNLKNDLKCRLTLSIKTQRELLVRFFFISKMQLVPLFLACAKQKMVACFNCEPANRDFQLWGERSRKCGWLHGLLLQKRLNQENRKKTQCCGVWSCLAHFNLFFNKELIERCVITAHTYSVGLCYCCRKKINLISLKIELKQNGWCIHFDSGGQG